MTRITGTVHEVLCIFMISLIFRLRMRDFSDIFQEKIKTNVLHSVFSQNLGVYETTWNNMIDPERLHNNKNGAYALHDG